MRIILTHCEDKLLPGAKNAHNSETLSTDSRDPTGDKANNLRELGEKMLREDVRKSLITPGKMM